MQIGLLKLRRGIIGGYHFNATMIVFLLALISHNVALGSEDANGVVYRLYRDFAWEAVIPAMDRSAAIANQPRMVLERYFDGTLSALLVRDANCNRSAKGEVCNLDFDPIFASQDPAAYNLIITTLAKDVIGVQFTYPPNGKTIQLEFKTKYGHQGWRIVDILYKSSGNASLKEILNKKESK